VVDVAGSVCEINRRWNANYIMIALQLVAGSEDDFHMWNGVEWVCPDILQK
jgi:hypothetical protein